eukprot:3425172-Prymnesium_polylepis.1
MSDAVDPTDAAAAREVSQQPTYDCAPKRHFSTDLTQPGLRHIQDTHETCPRGRVACSHVTAPRHPANPLTLMYTCGQTRWRRDLPTPLHKTQKQNARYHCSMQPVPNAGP